jgi:ATP-dependent DNA helicase RecQ
MLSDPAMINEGICLVISPLVALMKDQVANLQKRNIKAMH